MRNIEKLRNYFLGKDPQLKETMADNSLRLIGIPGREFVLRIELLRRLGELKKELTDKDTELEGLINNLQSALSSETLARQNADRGLSDRITTNANDIVAINQWRNNTDFVLADDLAAALLNYYTKAEVDAIIAAIPTLTYEVVQALPTTNISRRTIYMVHPQGAEEPDYYNEYIYMGDTSQPYDPDNWELIGNTRIDLTNYYTKAEVDAELAERDDAIEDVADDLDVVAQHLDDVEEEVDDLYDNWPTATATGNPINVQDSSNLPIKDFALGGNATQGADPTPDSPQDIHVVTGDNTLNIAHKNILDIVSHFNQYPAGSGYAKYRLNANNGIELVSGSATFGWGYNNSQVKFSLPAGTYTISAFETAFRLYNANNEIVAHSSSSSNDTKPNEPATFTLTETTNLGIITKPASGSASYAMIEIGTHTASSYEKYQTPQTQLLSLGQIELCKIGTYQDRIYKSGGKWYVEKNIATKTLNGTENWQSASSVASGTTRFYYEYNNDLKALWDICLISDHFVATTWGAIYQTDTTSKNLIATNDSTTNKRFVIRIDNNYASTVEDFKTWLGNNNTLVYYILKEPTTTEITDTTLIGQLENILAMHTNKNVTNFSIVPTGTNAEPTAEVEYRVEVKEYNNFTGTDGSSAGTSGLVPAPATTDSGKYLKADGTWGTPSGGGGGTSDYADLTNKPQINGVVLAGDKTTSDLGITVPTQTSDLTNDSGFITSADVPTATSELTNDSGFITNAVDNLTNYTPTSSLSAVATSGDYDDLSNKPTVPSITYSTTDLTPGTSQLDTGSFYFCYE